MTHLEDLMVTVVVTVVALVVTVVVLVVTVVALVVTQQGLVVTQQGLLVRGLHGHGIIVHCGCGFDHRNKRRFMWHRPSRPNQKRSELEISNLVSRYGEFWCHIGFISDC